MIDWITAALLAVGSFFGLVAALGIVKMPDLFTRMQASTKAATLGVSCIVLAVAVHFDDVGVTTRALLVVAFLFLTAPVAAHMIGKTAYLIGTPFWVGTRLDEWHSRPPDSEVPPEAVRE